MGQFLESRRFMQVLVIVILVCTSSLSNAQDIITLKRGSRIEAIITEIKGDIVRYKYFSDPQGRVLFVYKDMISSILYQDGKIEKFEDSEQQTPVHKYEEEEISYSNTQDIIITRTGEEIEAKVLDIGLTEVKYKRYDNQSGPSYTLKKSEIFMIKYVNGNKDVFDEITDQQPMINNQRISPYDRNVNYQQLPALKYTFGNQISPYGSEKSPFLAGFLSWIIPGAGQFYNGDIGGGFLFLGCNILCNSMWMSAIESDRYGYTYINNETAFTVGIIGAIVVNISSIVNASKVAKKVNIARGYRFGDNTYLKIQPTLLQQNNFTTNKEYAYGMNFCLSF
jgi:TM2 domain-containing membrane protein YozV